MLTSIHWTEALFIALMGAAIAILLLAITLLVLRLFGLKLIWRRRARTMRIKAPSPKKSDSADDEELPEEALIALLTAAALAALDDADTNRFRVVAFRRI